MRNKKVKVVLSSMLIGLLASTQVFAATYKSDYFVVKRRANHNTVYSTNVYAFVNFWKPTVGQNKYRGSVSMSGDGEVINYKFTSSKGNVLHDGQLSWWKTKDTVEEKIGYGNKNVALKMVFLSEDWKGKTHYPHVYIDRDPS